MDLTNPKLIYLKGFLFLLTGLIACAVILLEHPSLKLALLSEDRSLYRPSIAVL